MTQAQTTPRKWLSISCNVCKATLRVRPKDNGSEVLKSFWEQHWEQHVERCLNAG